VSQAFAERMGSVMSSMPEGKAARMSLVLLGRQRGMAPARVSGDAQSSRETPRAGKMVGRGSGDPLGDAVADHGGGEIEFADGAKETSDVLIENLFGGLGCFCVGANIDAAAVAALGPAIALQLPVAGADGVGMDVEAARQFAGAGETVAGAQVAAEDRQDNLGDELAINGDFATGGEPESHAQPPGYCDTAGAPTIRRFVLSRSARGSGPTVDKIA